MKEEIVDDSGGGSVQCIDFVIDEPVVGLCEVIDVYRTFDCMVNESLLEPIGDIFANIG